jgi:actin-like ATPase involved in cell morphogenesis
VTGPTAYRLGVDFGTSTTVAMLQWPDGRVRPLLFDGSPLLPSAVLIGPDGALHTGRDAAHLARTAPERLEPHPKRAMGEQRILLGDREVEVGELIVGVLGRVADEARKVAEIPQDVVFTHPVDWGPARRAMLVEAAQRAGLGTPRLIGEPVAAAAYFAGHQARQLKPGAPFLIYDLGAGTCDVTILRPAPSELGRTGYEVLGSAGLEDLGGIDLDEALVNALQARHGALWTDAASRRQVWDDVRTAKEMLSRTAGTIVAVPALRTEIPLNRDEFDAVAGPVLQRTVDLVGRLLAKCGLTATDLAGVFLVGGASRTPLVSTMLHNALGIRPIVTEQPQLVVAEGALHVDAPQAPRLTMPPPPVFAPTTGPVFVAPAARPAGLPAAARIAIAACVALVLVAVATVVGLTITTASRAERFGGGSVHVESTSRPGPHITFGNGGPGAPLENTKVPTKYNFEKFGDICPLVTTANLKKIFESDGIPPDSNRAEGGYSSCILSPDHKDKSGLGIGVNTLDMTVWVYDSDQDAITWMAKEKNNFDKKGNVTAPEPGIGLEAFTHRQVNDPKKISDIDYGIEIRDANLRFEVGFAGKRIDSKFWSAADETKIEQAVLADAKASYAKIVIP